MSLSGSSGRTEAFSYVWDVNTLAWVKASATGGGGGGSPTTVDQGAAGVDPWTVTGPLTDAELRASAVPISAVSLPLPSGAATETKQDTANTSLSSIDGKIPALGQALAAGSVPVVLTAAQVSTLTPPAAITGFLTESDFDTKVGALTETAPGTDTASSGLNGRLQRIAQRLTSLIGLLPTALGAGGGLKIDGSGTALPISGTVTADAGSGPFPVSDNAGSLTVDAPVGTPVFVRLSDGASAITTLPVSAASLPLPTGAATAALQTQPGVDIGDVTVNNGSGASAVNVQDGGNSLTVDGTVTVTQSTATSLKTQAEAYQGGSAVAAGNPLQVTLANTGANTTAVKVDGSAVTQPVSGTVTSAPTAPAWYIHHLPAANTQATITRAAAGVGVKNVCLGFTVTLAAQSTAPAAVQLSVSLIDGASGGGTYLWRSVISLPAIAGAVSSITLSNVYLVGTANTALTLEFSAAGGANTIESVSMRGTTL